jgi:magnesium-transporting ATPase (P-type)
MVYLCTFGFEDLIRENVEESLNLIRFSNKEADKSERAGVTIRMVSGDHKETCY